MKNICIDLGHGGSTGAKHNNIIEDDWINITAEECISVLKESGFNVIQTRKENKSIDLTERTKISNNFNSDFFLSIHFNSGGGEGFECIRTIRESIISVGIANKILSKLDRIPQVQRRTPIYTKKMVSKNVDYFAVLRGTKCPALIVEGGFIDNVNDVKRFSNKQNLKELGRIYAESIIEYFHGTVKYPTKVNTDEEFMKAKKGIIKINQLNTLLVKIKPNSNAERYSYYLSNGSIVNILYPCGDYLAILTDNKDTKGVGYILKSCVNIIE